MNANFVKVGTQYINIARVQNIYESKGYPIGSNYNTDAVQPSLALDFDAAHENGYALQLFGAERDDLLAWLNANSADVCGLSQVKDAPIQDTALVPPASEAMPPASEAMPPTTEGMTDNARLDVAFLQYFLALANTLRTTGWASKRYLRSRVRNAVFTLDDNGYEVVVSAILKAYEVERISLE